MRSVTLIFWLKSFNSSITGPVTTLLLSASFIVYRISYIQQICDKIIQAASAETYSSFSAAGRITHSVIRRMKAKIHDK
jgi:hypothetical protein